MGRVGPGALGHDGRPGRGVLLDGEDALGRLLDRHLETGVEQQRDVGGYDGRTPLGAAGLGPDPHMDRLHTVRMASTRSVDAVALAGREMPPRRRQQRKPDRRRSSHCVDARAPQREGRALRRCRHPRTPRRRCAEQARPAGEPPGHARDPNSAPTEGAQTTARQQVQASSSSDCRGFGSALKGVVPRVRPSPRSGEMMHLRCRRRLPFIRWDSEGSRCLCALSCGVARRHARSAPTAGITLQASGRARPWGRARSKELVGQAISGTCRCA